MSALARLTEENLNKQLVRPELPSEVRQFLQNCETSASRIMVSTPDEYEQAAEWRQICANFIGLIEGILAPNIKLLFTAHRAATQYRSEIINRLENADRMVMLKRQAFEILQKQVAEERQKLLEQEGHKENLEKAEVEAREMERMGEHEAAAAIREEASMAPPPAVAVAPVIPHTPGMVKNVKYTFEIVKPELLKKEFVMTVPDMEAIKAKVKQLGFQAESAVGKGAIKVRKVETESVRQSRR